MGPHEQVSIFISFDGQSHIGQHEQVLISLDLHPGKIRCHSEPASWEAFRVGREGSVSKHVFVDILEVDQQPCTNMTSIIAKFRSFLTL